LRDSDGGTFRVVHNGGGDLETIGGLHHDAHRVGGVHRDVALQVVYLKGKL
jgi:hypothetical protein